MDKIYLNEMEFYGYHGVLQEETKLGQRFRVNIVAELDFQEAGKTDNHEKTVSYAEIYVVCKKIVECNAYKLIEAVAEKIGEEVFATFTLIVRLTVKVVKPDPPFPGHSRSVAVEIT